MSRPAGGCALRLLCLPPSSPVAPLGVSVPHPLPVFVRVALIALVPSSARVARVASASVVALGPGWVTVLAAIAVLCAAAGLNDRFVASVRLQGPVMHSAAGGVVVMVRCPVGCRRGVPAPRLRTSPAFLLVLRHRSEATVRPCRRSQ